MIICCLCPFAGRYSQSSFSDVQRRFYYKNVFDFADRLDRIAFCGSEPYFSTPDKRTGQKTPVNLSDFEETVCCQQIPDPEICGQTDKTFVPQDLMDQLVRECRGSEFQVWRKIMTEAYPPLVDFYRDFLQKCGAQEPVEFIRCAAYDASLSAAAAECKVPVVHSDSGPLSSPDCLAAVYWNLLGPDGADDCTARWEAAAARDWKNQELSREELLFLFCRDHEKYDARTAAQPQDADAGVVLQADNDPDIIAFSNGYSNYEAVQLAENLFPNGKVILRRDPEAKNLYAGKYDVDESGYHFIQRVGLVVSISSPAALESVLMGKNVLILGDSPLRLLSSEIRSGKIIPPENLSAKLNFILLNLLVPVSEADTLEYTQWRLTKPSEIEIRKRHLDKILRLRGFRDLEQFRKSFRDHHPIPRTESAGPLAVVEPDAVMTQLFNAADVQSAEARKTCTARFDRHAEREKSHETLSRQYRNAETELQHSREQFEIQSRLVNEFNAKLDALHREIEQNLPALHLLCRQYSQLNPGEQCRKFYELWQQFITGRQEQLKMESQYRQMELHCQDLTLKLQDHELLKKQLLSQINSLSEQLKAVTESASGQEELLKLHETLKNEHDQLLQNHARLSGDHQKLTADHKILEQRFSQLSSAHSNLKINYDELDRKNAYLQQEFQTLDQNRADLQSDFDRLQQNYTSLEKQHAGLNNAFLELKKDHTVLEKDFSEQSAVLQELYSDYEQLLRDLNDLKDAQQKLNREYVLLNRQYFTLDFDYDQLVNTHTGLQNDYDSLSRSYEDLKNQHQEQNRDLEETR